MVHFNPVSASAVDPASTYRVREHGKGAEKAPTNPVSDSMSSAAPSTPAANAGDKWYSKPVAWVKQGWTALVSCFKSIFCWCFKPAQSQVASEMDVFAQTVKADKPKHEDVKKAFDNLPKTEKAEVLRAIRAITGGDDDAAEAVVQKENDFNAKTIAKALDRLAVHKELKAFYDVFKEDDAKPEQIRAAYDSLSTVAQQALQAAMHANLDDKTMDAVQYMCANHRADKVGNAVEAARAHYKLPE